MHKSKYEVIEHLLLYLRILYKNYLSLYNRGISISQNLVNDKYAYSICLYVSHIYEFFKSDIKYLGTIYHQSHICTTYNIK